MAKIQQNIGFQINEIRLLQVLVVCLFLGRAYQGIYWDLPLRAFFWNSYLLKDFVEWFWGISWQEYATDVEHTDAFINRLNKGLGFFWLGCAAIAALIHLKKRWMAWVMYLASFSLLLLSTLYWMDLFFAWGQFFEYALQVCAPLWLVHVVFNGQNTARFRWGLKIGIALAFFCHGLYAYGYYPQPGPWVQWCMDMFFIRPDDNAKAFLKIMGLLDFIVAGMVLIPYRPVLNIALWYCIIWGSMTALARVTSNFYLDFPLESLHQWTFETLVRLLHGGIPLLLWVWERRQGKV
jgi:hypothetical protein